ncbi:translocation and assembly module lipoprotein TamL [Spirosoma profusum]|nr:BamA/TamA family outer membrane protein [Spirosoma profusum]
MYAIRCMMYGWLEKPISYITHHTLKIGLLILVASLSSCFSSKQLRSNEYILTSQTFRGNKTISDENLESLIPQKPNRRLLGLPITPQLWFYQIGQRKYDREAAIRELQAKTNEFEQQSQLLANQPNALKKLNRRYERKLKKLRVKAEEGNWAMRNMGDPPSYFAEKDAQANAAKMQKYIADKGFFNAQVGYKLDTLRRRQIRVNYLIAEHAGYYLRNVFYEIADPQLDTIVRKSLEDAKLQVGDRFDFENMTAERIRIETLLRDQGYYAFSRQYIRATDVDTVRRGTDRFQLGDTTDRKVDVVLQIANPPGRSSHPIYHIGDVEVRISPNGDTDVPDASTAGARVPGASRYDTLQRSGIRYLLGNRNISLSLLESKILFRPNQLYSQTNYRDTQRQLFLLNQFKFVNLNFIDTTNRQLRTLITASPLDKYDYTFEGGVFVLAQTRPGPFANVTFRARNLFGGFETFETTVRYGLEYQTGFDTDQSSKQAFYQSNEFGVISSLTFPQILFPGRGRFFFNRYNPRTQVSLSFNNTIRPDYKRSLLRSTMAYNWQTTPSKQFSFLIADINLINANFPDTPLGQAFYEQIRRQYEDEGSTVYLSFRKSLSSSFSFAYTYNTNVQGQNRRANFFRAAVESGGTTLNFFSSKTIDQWSDATGLQFYKFLRLSVDYRHYIPIRSRTTLAFRFNTGIVYGYGFGENSTAPYEKLFFAGGSNSIRGWLPRRLGPGSEVPQPTPGYPTVPTLSQRDGRKEQFAYTFEKPGDMLIEGSAELRGRLFRLGADINGALFVDAGNVWTIRNNPRRVGEQFQLDTFIPQIAVGTGVGLRIDFSFFVIRLDGGIKVWDPARRYQPKPDEPFVDERFMLREFSFRRLSTGKNPMIINFGIGYPF